jgi:outer membrane biogenesis lipoprotein LolB
MKSFSGQRILFGAVVLLLLSAGCASASDSSSKSAADAAHKAAAKGAKKLR